MLGVPVPEATPWDQSATGGDGRAGVGAPRPPGHQPGRAGL